MYTHRHTLNLRINRSSGRRVSSGMFTRPLYSTDYCAVAYFSVSLSINYTCRDQRLLWSNRMDNIWKTGDRLKTGLKTKAKVTTTCSDSYQPAPSEMF